MRQNSFRGQFGWRDRFCSINQSWRHTPRGASPRLPYGAIPGGHASPVPMQAFFPYWVTPSKWHLLSAAHEQTVSSSKPSNTLNLGLGTGNPSPKGFASTCSASRTITRTTSDSAKITASSQYCRQILHNDFGPQLCLVPSPSWGRHRPQASLVETHVGASPVRQALSSGQLLTYRTWTLLIQVSGVSADDTVPIPLPDRADPPLFFQPGGMVPWFCSHYANSFPGPNSCRRKKFWHGRDLGDKDPQRWNMNKF